MLREDHGLDMWLIRPLPANLLHEAARDVRLIAAIYPRILSKGSRAKTRASLDAIKSASARYMRSWPSRELKALHVPLELVKFAPLDILYAPEPDARRYRCERCERMLSLGCFFTRFVEFAPDGEAVECAEGTGEDVHMQRMPLCRLCVLIARRNVAGESSLGVWVLLM